MMALGTLRTVLVPLDGSELAERAIGPARQIAAARRASVLLLQVVAPHGPAERGLAVPALEQAGQYLAGVADRLRAGGVTVLVEACAGQPAEQIAAQATLWGSDLVVMSTHGRGGFDELVHGSVADAVVRAASVPVLLVSARGGPRPEIAGETVLVAVDGSSFAEAALGQAAELARELAIPVTVLQAVWYLPSMVEGLAPTFGRLDRMVAEGRAYVDGLVAQLRGAGVEAHGEVMVGPPVAAIRGCADQRGAALIVMATHGRGAVGRLALGSVAHEVLTRTSHPVLLVRQPPAAAAEPVEVPGRQPAGAAR
jgi:nucleotide-binding universal stress UspA family protein